MQREQHACHQCGAAIPEQLPNHHSEQNCDQHMFHDAEEMPSPGRQLAEDEIEPHPQNEDRTVETRWTASELRPYVIRKVFPDVTRGLHSGIIYETVVVENELKIQRWAVSREDNNDQRNGNEGKVQRRQQFQCSWPW